MSLAVLTSNESGANSLTDINANFSALENSGQSLYRQAIINGNFDVWQRGTSFALSASSIFGADRWRDNAGADGGTLPTLTRTRELLTSGELFGSYYFSRLTTDGAGDSLGNNSFQYCSHKIENGTKYLCGASKQVTLSFYARSSIANKKLGVGILQSYGTGGSPTTAEFLTTEAQVLSLTSSWVKYTLTVDTNTLSGKTFGTAGNDNLGFYFFNQWGSTQATSWGLTGTETYVGSGTIDIAQVQLNTGSVALPFQPKSYAEELRDCQRYYELIGSGLLGRAVTNSIINVTGKFVVPKRAVPSTPTLTTTSPAITEINTAGRTGSSSAVSSSNILTATGFNCDIDGFGSTLTSPNMVTLNTDFIIISAEL